MICTEEEAESEWCPKFHGGSGSNRWHPGKGSEVSEQTCCLGSMCMWWEWVDRTSLRAFYLDKISRHDLPVGRCGGIR